MNVLEWFWHKSGLVCMTLDDILGHTWDNLSINIDHVYCTYSFRRENGLLRELVALYRGDKPAVDTQLKSSINKGTF